MILESASIFALAIVAFIVTTPLPGVRQASHGRRYTGERGGAFPAQASGASGPQTPKPGDAAPGGG